MNGFILMLNTAAASWSAALFRATLQGGLALALVWSAVHMWPRMAAVTQCWLWRLAYLKLITAFVWSTPVLVPILPPSVNTANAHRTAQVAPATAISGHATDTAIAVIEPTPTSQTDSQAVVSTKVQASGPTSSLTNAAAPTLLARAMAVWGMVAAGFAASLLLQWRAALKIYRSSYPLQEGELITSCAQISHRMGLKHIPWLMAWRGGDTPLVLGGLKPVILLPEALLIDCGASELELMLAHELAHISRRDLLWAWLPLLARILFWFNPLVWIGLHELNTAQEMDSDALALKVTLAPVAEYGSLLLRVAARRCSDVRSEHVMLGMADSYQTLKRRLLAMKSNSFTTPNSFGRRSVALLSLASVGIVPWQVSAQSSTSAADLPHVQSSVSGNAPRSGVAASTVKTIPGAASSVGKGVASASSSAGRRDVTTALAGLPQTQSGGQSNGTGVGHTTGTAEGQSSGATSGPAVETSGGQSGVTIGVESGSGGSAQSHSAASSGGSSSPFISGGIRSPKILAEPLKAAAGKYTVYLDQTDLTNQPGGPSSVSFSANGVRFTPNVEISLWVTAANSIDLQQIAGISPRAIAIELSGAESKQSEAAQPLMEPRIDGVYQSAIYLKIADTGAKSLKSLEGALLVKEDKPIRVELGVTDLKVGAIKTVGDITVKVESYRISGNNVDIELSVLSPGHSIDAFAMAQAPHRVPGARMQNFGNREGTQVELLDQNKRSYLPSSMSVTAGNGSTASARFGGLSNGGAYSSFGGKDTQNNSRNGNSINNGGQGSSNSRRGEGAEKQSIRLSFPAPADGATPAGLVLSIANKSAITQRIPFKFTNVPLPAGQ